MFRFLTPRRFITATLIISLWGFAIMYHLTHQIPENLLNDPEFLRQRYEQLSKLDDSIQEVFDSDSSGETDSSEIKSLNSGEYSPVYDKDTPVDTPVELETPIEKISAEDEDRRVMEMLGVDPDDIDQEIPRKEATPVKSIKNADVVERFSESQIAGSDEENAEPVSELVKPEVSCKEKSEWKECDKEQRTLWKAWEADYKKEQERLHYLSIFGKDTGRLNMHSGTKHNHTDLSGEGVQQSYGGSKYGSQGAERVINKSMAIAMGKAVSANQGLPTEGIEECPFEMNNDYGEDFTQITPHLNSIRRDHYLLNLSPFGPNNQLRGFRDTLILAIYLNRTIVMPPFFKHRTDPSSQRSGYLYQDPQEKLDGEKIAEFMPVITLKQFSERCSEGLDVAFLARSNSNTSEIGRLSMYQKILGIPLINQPYHRGMKVMKAPTAINPRTYRKRSREESYVSMSKISANIAYGPEAPGSNDGPCAMWVEPYRNTLITQHLSSWAKKTMHPYHNEEDTNNLLQRPAELAARMMNATCRAKSVRSAADEFITKVMGARSYMAMHWRYDENDFGKHCSKGFGGQGICGMVENSSPDEVGTRLAGFLLKNVQVALDPATAQLMMKGVAPPLKDKVIYIAAPPKESKNINIMKDNIIKDSIEVFYGEDLQKFLKERHENCPQAMVRDQMHDFVSLVEMELCSRSQVFVYSGGSSWSRNILMERQAVRKEKWDVENSRFLAKDPSKVQETSEED